MTPAQSLEPIHTSLISLSSLVPWTTGTSYGLSGGPPRVVSLALQLLLLLRLVLLVLVILLLLLLVLLLLLRLVHLLVLLALLPLVVLLLLLLLLLRLRILLLKLLPILLLIILLSRSSWIPLASRWSPGVTNTGNDTS